MKRCIVFGLIITVFMLLIIGCDGNEDEENATDVIKIGVLLPFTLDGEESVMNQRLKGIILAKEEINTNGGLLDREIELVIADNQGKYDVNILKAQELVTKGCVAIIGAS